MSLTARTSKGKCKAKIDGEMTIYTACELKEKLLQKLAKCQSMELDLSQVTDFDTAGFQLLALLRREAECDDTSLLIKNHSPVIQDVFELYHVSEPLEWTFTNHGGAGTSLEGQV